MSFTKKSYPAFIFRQRPSAPLQVSFVAPSIEIDSWARVPTKRAANVRNFQRAEIRKHVEEVQTFFRDQHNASPTAVVVGFDPTRSQSAIRLLDRSRKQFADSEAFAEPREGFIEIAWIRDVDPSTVDDLLSAIARLLPRLTDVVHSELVDIVGMDRAALRDAAMEVAKALRAGQITDREADQIDAEDATTAVDDETSSDDDSNDFAFLDALLPALGGRSPGERQILLSRLVFLAQLQSDSLSTFGSERLERIYREVLDELKPGLLIDGQHRVMGTKGIGVVPFLVTALPSAPWQELAFQFIVTNRTARRVPESLLISIVGSSLSKDQRGEIEERLRQASIRVGLIEAVMMVHEDPQSPFTKTLKFGISNEEGFIDAAAMKSKVVKLWYEREPPVRELLDHFCQGRLVSDRTEYWKSETLWLGCFVAFWSAVKERYEGSQVFSFELNEKREPVSRLLTATVLMLFQKTVLVSLHRLLRDQANTLKKPIADSLPNNDALGALVASKLARLTPEFFQNWTLTGFDGSKGAREDLETAIRLVIDNELTVSQVKVGRNQQRLFKPPLTRHGRKS